MIHRILICLFFSATFIVINAQGTVKDYDGNVYATVKIGTQVWMMENLKVTHYRNGDPIPNVKDNIPWGKLTTGAYCNYNNDTNNVRVYGRLYNWYAVNDPRNICPPGWHIATDAEWAAMIAYLGTMADAGGKLKETDTLHWTRPNSGASNTSKFKARAAGSREMYGGFYYMGLSAFFWCKDAYDGLNAWKRELSFNDPSVSRYYTNKACGYSIRCVKD